MDHSVRPIIMNRCPRRPGFLNSLLPTTKVIDKNHYIYDDLKIRIKLSRRIFNLFERLYSHNLLVEHLNLPPPSLVV